MITRLRLLAHRFGLHRYEYADTGAVFFGDPVVGERCVVCGRWAR